MQAVTEILLDEDNYFLRNLGTNETAVLFEFHTWRRLGPSWRHLRCPRTSGRPVLRPVGVFNPAAHLRWVQGRAGPIV